MTKEEKFQIGVWIIIRSCSNRCPFCDNKKEEGHLPFCIFEDYQSRVSFGAKIVESDVLHKWIEGFSDGFNSVRKQKSPYYLMGNKAGREMKT